MNDQELCAFGLCNIELARVSSSTPAENDETARLTEILSSGGTCENCEGELATCLSSNGCNQQTGGSSCEDPYLGIEGCECVGLESAFFEDFYRGSRGCFAQPDDPSRNWKLGRRCHVENPTKCAANLKAQNSLVDAPEDQIPGLYSGSIIVQDINADFRRGCCFETSPYYSEAETCPKSEDVPNTLMCVGFFVANSITLVCPLVFITTASFKGGWIIIYHLLVCKKKGRIYNGASVASSTAS
jgi:hypothetical protein